MSQSVAGQSRWTGVRDIIVGGSTIVATVIASPLLRRRYNRYGATSAEVAAVMPGDDLVRQPKLGFTRAITIDAPPADVWPWLAQIGQGRGGLYSYDGLENLVGCDIHSTVDLLAEHQNLDPGDIIRSGPDKYPCWIVMEVNPPHHLVLLGAGTPGQIAVPEVLDEIPAEDYAASTWQWQLLAGDGGTQTRLVVRQRLTFSPGQGLIWRLVEPINFAMEHKMLKGLKARAETGYEQLGAFLDEGPRRPRGPMKGIVRPRYGPPDVLELNDIPIPSPGEGEVLVRVHAASVGAWDWHYLGADPHFMRLITGLRKPRVPVAGIDLAGEVVAIGANVTRLRPGDEVYGVGEGTFAQFTCTHETKLAPKPDNLSFEQAAAVPTAAATALIGLRDSARLQAGQTVLIIGASGGVGTFAIQIAKALGAEVTAVCSTPNVDLVRSIGADHVIDYREEDLTETERRYDVILQLAGKRSPLELREVLTPDGTLVLSSGEGGPWIGPGGRILAALAVSPFVRQRLCTFVADPDQEHLLALSELIEAGEVTPVLDKTYPLSDAASAIRYVQQGHTRGKTVLTM